MAISIYFEIDQGSDFIADIPLFDTEGNPLDISGFIVKSQFKKHYSSKTFHDFEAFNVNPSEGIIRLRLPGLVSSEIKPGRYIYDVEINNGSNKFRVVEGILEINPEITKS